MGSNETNFSMTMAEFIARENPVMEELSGIDKVVDEVVEGIENGLY